MDHANYTTLFQPRIQMQIRLSFGVFCQAHIITWVLEDVCLPRGWFRCIIFMDLHPYNIMLLLLYSLGMAQPHHATECKSFSCCTSKSTIPLVFCGSFGYSLAHWLVQYARVCWGVDFIKWKRLEWKQEKWRGFGMVECKLE